IGVARTDRSGDDVTIVSYSHGLVTARAAADQLQSQGTSVDLIDVRTIYPLDEETILASLRRTGRLVVVDEGPRFGSFGSQVAAIMQERAFWYLDAPIEVVAAQQVPIPHHPTLVDAILPSQAQVVAAAERTLRRS